MKVQLSGREEELKKAEAEVTKLNMILEKQRECNE